MSAVRKIRFAIRIILALIIVLGLYHLGMYLFMIGSWEISVVYDIPKLWAMYHIGDNLVVLVLLFIVYKFLQYSPKLIRLKHIPMLVGIYYIVKLIANIALISEKVRDYVKTEMPVDMPLVLTVGVIIVIFIIVEFYN